MTIARRTGTVAAGALAVMFTLTGCIGDSPSATPTPDSATATPTPTPEPANPFTTVVELVARPTGLELRADDGTVVATLDYMSSPADAVTALTTVFGTPPVDEPYPGDNHYPAGVFHRWDRFVVDEQFYDEDRRQADGYDWLVWPRFTVIFDGPAAEGVVLSTSSGLQAGDAWSAAEADPGFDPRTSGPAGARPLRPWPSRCRVVGQVGPGERGRRAHRRWVDREVDRRTRDGDRRLRMSADHATSARPEARAPAATASAKGTPT